MTAADYRALGLDARDATAFAEAAQAGIPGNLVLVRCADAGLAFEAAKLAAHARLAGPHAALDVHLAVPVADKWTMAEVDDRILRPARLKAFDRTHIVVADADQMAPAAFDHILKTVEEPTSGALFWFAVTDVDRLPVTLRGRSAATFRLRPAPAAERSELLERAGASAGHARTVSDLAGDDIRLALAVAADEGLLGDLREYRTTPLVSVAPTADADRVLGAIIRLAAALPSAEVTADEGEDQPKKRTRAAAKTAAVKTSAGLRPRWDTLTPAARPGARRLVRRLLDRWTADLITQVGAAETHQVLERIERGLHALEDARDELATNAPAGTALPALLARANA